MPIGLCDRFDNQKVWVLSVNQSLLTLPLLLPRAHTEQTGAHQHLQAAGMSPVSMVVEKKGVGRYFEQVPTHSLSSVA